MNTTTAAAAAATVAEFSSPFSLSAAIPALGIGALGLLLAKDILAKKAGSGGKQSNLPLPPGPKGKPIIKNLLDLPLEDQWIPATKWAKEFGDVVHLSVAGEHLIFLSDHQAILDLLEKRSSVSSDRAVTTMVELMDVEKLFAFMRYGPGWRVRRRIFHQEFNTNTVEKHRDVQTKVAQNLMSFLLEEPEELDEHLKYFAAAVILEAVYGFDVKPKDDPYVKIAEDGLQFVTGMISGTYLVDAFPFLRSFPDWLPGSASVVGTKIARYYRRTLNEFRRVPFEVISEKYEAGTARHSLVASQLAKINAMPEGQEKEDMVQAVQDVAATAFGAGFDTTTASLLNFVLAMVQYPEVQRKAQEELDRVVGQDRLVDYNDKENLPYINALIKEIKRWAPISPLGVPHKLTSEEEYKGMRLPMGSVILPNVWAITRNEAMCGPDPEAFKPERFLDPNFEALDPNEWVFGFGRRVCPGRYLAENSVFIAVSYMLQLFSIGKAYDKNGVEKPLNPRRVPGLTTHLEPFPCHFTPRFEGVDKLVHLSLGEA